MKSFAIAVSAVAIASILALVLDGDGSQKAVDTPNGSALERPGREGSNANRGVNGGFRTDGAAHSDQSSGREFTESPALSSAPSFKNLEGVWSEAVRPGGRVLIRGRLYEVVGNGKSEASVASDSHGQLVMLRDIETGHHEFRRAAVRVYIGSGEGRAGLISALAENAKMVVATEDYIDFLLRPSTVKQVLGILALDSRVQNTRMLPLRHPPALK